MKVDVKALRTRLAWSQSDLAKFMCIADSTVARWEAGDRIPTGRTGDDLASLDNVTTRATPALLKAFTDAARRGETVRSLMTKALEGMTKDGPRARGQERQT